MRHKFTNVEIPEGESSVEQVCHCGAVSRLYKSGARLYRQADGTYGGKSGQCGSPIQLKGKDPEMPERSIFVPAAGKGVIENKKRLIAGPDGWPADMPEEQKREITLETRALIDKYQMLKDARTSPDLVAKLKDAYAIITILFEDMTAAGLRTPGRAIAGRLLFSEGYSEIVKTLQAS